MANAPVEPEVLEASRQARNVTIAIAVALVILTGGLIALAIVLALNADTAGAGVKIVRDMVIILLAIEAIAVAVAITVLVIQVARFINLLTNEVQPLITTATDTVKTVRGTAEFVSKHVTQPVIAAAGTVGGIGKAMADADVIRKAAGIAFQTWMASGSANSQAGRGDAGTPVDPAAPPAAPSSGAPPASGENRATIKPDGTGPAAEAVCDNF